MRSDTSPISFRFQLCLYVDSFLTVNSLFVLEKIPPCCLYLSQPEFVREVSSCIGASNTRPQLSDDFAEGFVGYLHDA